jgi:hypothetical protein
VTAIFTERTTRGIPKLMLKFKLSGAHALAALALALIVMSATPVEAGSINFVTNGDFETLAAGNTLGSAGGYFCQSGATCVSNLSNWSSVCHTGNACGAGGTPDSLLFASTSGSAFNGGIGLWTDGANGVTPSTPLPNSPTGGNFVAFDGDPNYNASISQTITGLLPGSTYTLSFWQAAGQQNGTTGPTTEQWSVTFANQTKTSTLMNNVSHGWVNWNQQVMSFTVSAQSTGTEVLSFLSQGTPNGQPPVVMLDGISLVSTPEPQTCALVGLGLVAIPWFMRRRMVRNTIPVSRLQ